METEEKPPAPRMSKNMRRAASRLDWDAVKSLIDHKGESIVAENYRHKHITGIAADGYARQFNLLKRKKHKLPHGEYNAKEGDLIRRFENFIRLATEYRTYLLDATQLRE